ncbi:MAG: GGDEF domain-containing protein [Aquificaceae bacterium]|nr:GGDEF domain-containing protein [Aquificaceae bacterium]MDW8423955.1 GGDEF domain-containing protein [Aquificaceae bacterium]
MIREENNKDNIEGSGERELKNYIPSVIIDSNYNLIALNSTAKKMFGEVIGKKCYRVLYGFNEPCYQRGIKCPVYDKVVDTDLVNIDYENYIRSYGKVPMGGIYWESVINITSIEILRSSIIDPLSNLYNRKFAESFLEKSFTLWERYGQPFGLMFIDIDNLKEINDRYGHIMGDRVIEKISACLKVMVRSSDVACRYGGDEFLVILPNTNLDASEHAAVRLFRCVEQVQLIAPVSVSIGLTQTLKEDKSYKDVIKRADDAMYKAKRAGKGRIGVAKSKEEQYLIYVEGGIEDEKGKSAR